MVGRVLGAWISLVILLPAISSAQEWVARYDGADHWWDMPRAIALDSAANVYVTGGEGVGIATSGHFFCRDIATVKYDSSGVEQWVSTYNGPGNSWDEAYAIVVDSAGAVCVTGESWGSGTDSDYVTVKYGPLGVAQWVARYNGPDNAGDRAYAIAVDNARNVYVAGRSFGSNTSYDYATAKYDSSGVEQWVRRYDGAVNGWDEAFAIALDDRANVYVTGKSFGSGTDMDYATVSYDSSGVERWVARYNGPGDDYDRAGAIAVDNAGNAYVTGNSSGSGTGYDYATLKYGPLGTEQWVARYNGPGNDGDWALAIAVDNAGNVCVTGGSCGLGTRTDYATIKYDSSSTEQWVVRYDGPASVSDMAHAIALDNAGNVYVTGPSDGTSATYTDYATVKYNSSGMQQWVARYDGLGNWDDYATAIAVDNTGNAYVTGRSEGVLTNQDYATIKYATLGTQECVLRPSSPWQKPCMARGRRLPTV